MKGIVYDCEILRCIPAKEILPGYQYCDGWSDFRNMGISVIGVCDLESGDTEPFINKADCDLDYLPIADFAYLIEKIKANNEIVVGFNSFNFDDNLCRSNGIIVRSDYDLLRLVRRSAYGSVNWQDQPEGYSYSLDAIARANGYAKTGNGALAPQLWQDGKYREVIDYCLNDCQITRKLFLKYKNGELIDPNNGKILKPV